jgi:acetoin utilization deacetylase AcuC-like enzyme
VHHGNGTEEVVRWLKPGVEKATIQCDLAFGTLNAPYFKPWLSVNDSENVLFVSVHGYGPRSRGLENLFPLAAFYPGTGATVLPEVREILSHFSLFSESYFIVHLY